MLFDTLEQAHGKARNQADVVPRLRSESHWREVQSTLHINDIEQSQRQDHSLTIAATRAVALEQTRPCYRSSFCLRIRKSSIWGPWSAGMLPLRRMMAWGSGKREFEMDINTDVVAMGSTSLFLPHLSSLQSSRAQQPQISRSDLVTQHRASNSHPNQSICAPSHSSFPPLRPPAPLLRPLPMAGLTAPTPTRSRS